MSTRDELAGQLAASLNKQFKDTKVAYFLDGSDTTPTDIKEFISTGSTLLDLAISNRPHGGIAVGRITELNGLESSGKSLVGAHLLAETQKKGGVAVYIDTETAVSQDFLKVIGVDINNMLYLHLETVEDIFAAASTNVEMEADFDKDGWATSKAIIISKAMRKITQMIGRQRVALVFTNQLRQKLGVMFGDPWTTSGGKALPFHASTRVRLKNKGQIKDNKNNVIGMTILAQVVKNRLGPPLRSCEFPLYFESGIDDVGSWLKVMKDHKIVKQGGAWYTLTDHLGQEHKFQSKEFSDKLSDPDFKTFVYEQICEKVILKYDMKDLGIDDVVETEEVIGD
jgi:recombination protein RecA